METAPSVPTRKRYVRYEPTTELVLTQRDCWMLCDLHDRRFMSARQLQAIYGNNVPERLRWLYRHGYIDRPEAQKHWRIREGGGSYALIYALANPGARAIAVRKLRPQAARRNWSELNLNLSKLSSHIPHSLGISDAYVWFRRVCMARTGLALVQGFELAGESRGHALTIPGDVKTLIPDLIPALVPTEGKGKEELFFVEWHTGSEPNTRYSSLDLEHLTGKYEGYLAYARSKKCRAQFGIGNFRVLTITCGGEINKQHIVKAAHDVCGGNGVGRFLVTMASALEASDPLSVVWLDAKGNEVRVGV